MFPKVALVGVSMIAMALGQQTGTITTETHPTLSWAKCTKSGGCATQSSGRIVLDANWRWLHDKNGHTNCYTGSAFNATICPDGKTCAANCALEGAAYYSTFGITASGNAVTLKFVTESGSAPDSPSVSGKIIGSRVYLMASDTSYEMFQLLNQEFTFDVDVSRLGCGLNGAVYFAQMDADGGMAKYSTNKAGAKYGTGYCDSKCPRDIKFINGEANVQGWNSSGHGSYGACCNEMDVWEANNQAAAFTAHPCNPGGQTRCEGAACGGDDPYATVCDPDGCDFNSYRMGNTSFYGLSKKINTSKTFTVVTQFLTDDGTANGNLKEIRRLYVQNGVVINNSKVNILGLDPSMDSITDQFCDAQKSLFHDPKQFQAKGGLKGIGAGMKAGMVLVLSIDSDPSADLTWLDSTFPSDADPTAPGVARGPCALYPNPGTGIEEPIPFVTYSNIKFGDIGSTYGPGSTPTGGTPTTTSSAPSSTQVKYGQCGGQGWSGPTQCAAGSTCVYSNAYYSQCL